MKEGNHYSCDIIKIAAWTHNTNVNTLGNGPLQLVNWKSIMLPGMTSGYLAMESLYNDKAVTQIIGRHKVIQKGRGLQEGRESKGYKI